MSYAARADRPADKASRYAELAEEIASVLEGEPNRVARMATIASMLDRKSTRLNSSHIPLSRMPSSA